MDGYTDPDWANSALITVDFQNDFVLPGSPSGVAGTLEVVPAARRLLEAFRERGRPVVHAVRLYLPDGSNVDPCRRRAVERGESLAVAPGTPGAELVEALKPSPDTRLDAERLLGGGMQEIGISEWAMYKPRWGAFFGTPLHAHLQHLGVNTLVVCGCNFPNCPRTSIYEASERDYRAVAVTDAISGVYERGIRELQEIGVVPLHMEECLLRLDALSS
jgi:nicotinamidase-related amidase